jgi:hypothetical protein
VHVLPRNLQPAIEFVHAQLQLAGPVAVNRLNVSERTHIDVAGPLRPCAESLQCTQVAAVRLRRERGIFYAQGVKANVLFFDRRPAREKPWTARVWFYDLRTNKHFTLKQNRLTRADLDEFVELYMPELRTERTATWSEKNPEGRWRDYSYDEIVARDKASLDLFWLRDESLEDSAGLPDPHILAAEIADDLRASLEQIEDVLADLQARARGVA